MRYSTAMSLPPWKLESGVALALVGLSSIIGQIVLMRELMVVFNGNELSLGIMLATWLAWTAAGSFMANRLGVNRGSARRGVAFLECLLGFSLPATIWAVRASRSLLQTVPGELLGPVPLLLTSLSCLGLFCFISGALFVVAARMYAQERGILSSTASSSAYLFEACGSALGGILASLLLLRFLNSFQIAVVVALVNFSMAAILQFGAGRKQGLAVAVLAGCVAPPLFLYAVPGLLRSSQSHLWRGFHLLASRDSIYGNLSIIETGSIRSVYANGLILASVPDEAAAEEAVHYPLLEHAAPRKILLIGGGTNGSIMQILKHPTVERVDYVEIDPALIVMADQFFPRQLAPLAGDGRVDIHYIDGRAYLSTTREKFDVIILDVPDPQTAQLNRFYTVEFFRSASRHLADGGLFALQLRGAEEYISPELAEFLRCIHHTLRAAFPYVVTIPGETIHFMGALQTGLLTDDPQTLISRLEERHIQTHYVREYFMPFRMMPDRMAQVHDLLQPTPETPTNRDFAPIAYYFDVVLWSAQFKSSYHDLFRIAAQVRFASGIGGLIVLLLCVTILFRVLPVRQWRPRSAAVYCTGATGFTLMALQILLLLSFQSLYGYVYRQLAILIGTFMAGIALGSWLAINRVCASNERSPLGVAAVVQLLLAFAAPLMLLIVTLLSHDSSAANNLLTTQFVFPALAVLSGMLGGFQFPIASEIYLGESRAQTGLGVLYAVDLAGGCAGAVLPSTYLIPVFGFWKTAWITAAVNLAPAFLAMWVGREPRMSPA